MAGRGAYELILRLFRRVPKWVGALGLAVACWAVLENIRSPWRVDIVNGTVGVQLPSTMSAAVWHLVLWIAAALLLLRYWCFATSSGPILVRQVAVPPRMEQAPDGVQVSAPAPSSAALTATIQGVLHRVGVTPHGVIPTYSGLDAHASDLAAVTHPPMSGVLTRALVAFWRDSTQPQGWALTLEQRHAAGNGVGMAFVLEHRATGRIVYTGTAFGRDLTETGHEVAYRVAAWRLRKSSSRSTRENPSWYHSAEGIRTYDQGSGVIAIGPFHDVSRSWR